MKARVGVITFHAAHNYGSVLQAYALQQYVLSLGFECEIINFRTSAQKDQYRPLTKRKGIKYLVKNAYFLLHYFPRKEKYVKFESFINKYERLSSLEYHSLEDLFTAPLNYSHFICGSDQIWNTIPNDASLAYFLPFVNHGTKIAYAPSFGQLGPASLTDEITSLINSIDYLSVREEYGAKIVTEITRKPVPVLLDPTLLLTRLDWEKLIDKHPLLQGEYIFFYTLFADLEMVKIVKTISKLLGCKVVISNVSNQYEIFSGFQKLCNSGPLDFLNLIKNAKFVCTSSFHGTVFSILFHTPFFAIRGIADKRISTLLEITGLRDRALADLSALAEYDPVCLCSVDFHISDRNLVREKARAKEFLLHALS